MENEKKNEEFELTSYRERCFETLKELLVKLANNHGWFIIDIAKTGIYCQLRRDETEGKTTFEGVSHYYNKSLNNTLDNNFLSLGFQIRKNHNYAKKILLYSDDAVNKTALEIMHIFEKIYGIDKGSIFKFKDLINEY